MPALINITHSIKFIIVARCNTYSNGKFHKFSAMRRFKSKNIVYLVLTQNDIVPRCVQSKSSASCYPQQREDPSYIHT